MRIAAQLLVVFGASWAMFAFCFGPFYGTLSWAFGWVSMLIIGDR